MRGLTKKQEEILRDWYSRLTSKERENVQCIFWECDEHQEELNYEILQKLEEINNFETLNQAVTDYVQNVLNE